MTWKDWWTPVFLLIAIGLNIVGSFIAYHGKKRWHKKMILKKLLKFNDNGLIPTINDNDL